VKRRTYDIQFAGPRNRFALANGCIVSNSGKGIQPHNFIRGTLKHPEQLRIFDLLEHDDHEIFELLYEWPITAISSCMRGFIRAKPGHILRVVDYSSIEARVLAWMALEEEVLQA
jgi:DNA polymerase